MRRHSRMGCIAPSPYLARCCPPQRLALLLFPLPSPLLSGKPWGCPCPAIVSLSRLHPPSCPPPQESYSCRTA
ncbi:Os08g0136366 [Oryza sativa Japonica Group]|uniref:Os08g0136366 protein n=1 Tax=Oryza sativa subsp. japonica TaxID=39947 RepID=A0A0P0XBQ8_ORYSJ|nr:hypothetical protein EE612_042006 [Oryza sativa]BAT03742.1 Os08g0136366 [Oryza sativa Japonica Group]